MRMRRAVASVVVVSLLANTVLLALDSRGAAYVGGTVAIFPESKEPIEGQLGTGDEATMVFTAKDKPFAGKSFEIPYQKVIDSEYGQKAGRRVGAAVGSALLFGPIGLVALLSKKRRHYLTIGFKDASDKDQVAVMEIGKDIVRTTLAVIETRSGKKIEYQDDEARKSGLGQ